VAKLTDADIQSLLNKQKGSFARPQSNLDLDVSLDDVNSFGDKESLREMVGDIAKYNQMLQERITFVNEPLTSAIPFTRENLYVICAYTGSGKSTIAANISYPLWKQSKKTLVISNEESKQDVLFRVGCLELGYSFNEYKKGQMPPVQQLEIVKLFPEIAKYVKVVDVNYKEGLTTRLEGVKNALLAVKNADYSCAMIDYYQLIQYSTVDPTRSRYDVLNDLRIWMGQYIKSSNIPIVIFAQLHSIGKRQNKDIDSRIKECPSIIEPATVIIEAVPNFEEKTSDFIIHKDRFGLSGHKISCAFEKGRYVKLTDEHVKRVMATQDAAKAHQAQEKLANLTNLLEKKNG
jgi:hypothetical protein